MSVAAAIASVLFTSGAAVGQVMPAPAAAPATGADALVCVATEDGAPIPLGTQVEDQTGQRIGWVSISQCTENPGAGRIRLALQVDGDSRIRVVSLNGARMDQGQLKLAVTAQDVLALAPVTAADQSTTSGGTS